MWCWLHRSLFAVALVFAPSCASCQMPATPKPAHVALVASGHSETSVVVVPIDATHQNYVIGYNGGWAVSTNGGATWTTNTPAQGQPNVEPTVVLTGHPGQVAYVGGAGANVAVMLSVDGGAHFGSAASRPAPSISTTTSRTRRITARRGSRSRSSTIARGLSA